MTGRNYEVIFVLLANSGSGLIPAVLLFKSISLRELCKFYSNEKSGTLLGWFSIVMPAHFDAREVLEKRVGTEGW